MKKLLIVYQSQSGSTALLAQAVARGARLEADTEVRLRHALDADIADLLWCDGVLIGTPENFGYLSGLIKDFFDRTYYAALAAQLQRPYALFISAGNDGTGAQRCSLARRWTAARHNARGNPAPTIRVTGSVDPFRPGGEGVRLHPAGDIHWRRSSG